MGEEVTRWSTAGGNTDTEYSSVDAYNKFSCINGIIKRGNNAFSCAYNEGGGAPLRMGTLTQH